MDRQDKFDRREALLQAALSEFANNSFEAASLNSILKNAGVSKGVFYYYFRDKMDLYIQLFREQSRIKLAFITSQLEGKGFVREPGESFFSFLKRISLLGMTLQLKYPEMYQLGLRYNQESESFRSGLMENFQGDIENYLGPMIRAARESGEFSDRFPSSFVESILRFVLTHWIDFIDIDPGDTQEDLTDKITLLYDFLENGLGGKKE